MTTARALLEQAEALYRREIQRSLLVDPTLVAVGRLVVQALSELRQQDLRRCEMTTAEGEQIAAARENPIRLRGIIAEQHGKIADIAAMSDLDGLNRIVDAQQDILDGLHEAPILTNDTLQNNAA